MTQMDATTSIRSHAAMMLPYEHPYMKTETLNAMLDALTASVRDGIQKQ